MDHVLRPAGRRVLKAWYALRGLFNELREAAFWSKVLWLSGQPTIGRLVAEVMNWFYLMTTVRSETAERGIHLFDQGLCQAIWSIAYEASYAEITSRESLARLAQLLPAQSVIVLVEASLPTIGGRLQLRPGLASRVERDMAAGLSVTGFARAMGAMARTEAAIARLAKSGRITLLRLHNDADAELPEEAEKLADVLQRLSVASDEPVPAAAEAVLR